MKMMRLNGLLLLPKTLVRSIMNILVSNYSLREKPGVVIITTSGNMGMMQYFMLNLISMITIIQLMTPLNI